MNDIAILLILLTNFFSVIISVGFYVYFAVRIYKLEKQNDTTHEMIIRVDSKVEEVLVKYEETEEDILAN